MTPTPTHQIRAVLFDLDGTLVDTNRLYLAAYQRALEPVLGYCPTLEEFQARPPSSERRFLVDWVGAERADECHAAMRRHYAELHRTHFDGPFEGVPEMLAALRAAGFRLGVVTGKGRDAWEVTGHTPGLGGFDVVVTEDDVAHPKPDPHGIVTALGALGLSASAAVYVGDTVADLEAGRSAGVGVGAALWAKDPVERAAFLQRIRAFRPDWVLERPADLTRALAPWC